jgi:hypothetical protein
MVRRVHGSAHRLSAPHAGGIFPRMIRHTVLVTTDWFSRPPRRAR